MDRAALRERYKRFSDVELRELASADADALTDDARAALASEMASRNLSVDDTLSAVAALHRDASARLDGIRGWLALFTALITLHLVGLVLGLVFVMYENGPQGWKDLWFLLLVALAGVPSGFGLRFIWRRSPSAPQYWFAFLLVGAAVAFLATLGVGGDPVNALLRAAPAIAWAIYWRKSERVTQTFGRRTVPRRDPGDAVDPRAFALETKDAPELVPAPSTEPDQTADDGRVV